MVHYLRESGILLHPSCLPSLFAIGDLGPSAYEFLEKMYQSKQHLWQILPLNPTGFGDSPYQSPSALGANTLLISPEGLVQMGFLRKEDLTQCPPTPNPLQTDFELARAQKEPLFEKAYLRFLEMREKDPLLSTSFSLFAQQNSDWLEEHCFFLAVKRRLQQKRKEQPNGEAFQTFITSAPAWLSPETAKAYYLDAHWISWPAALRNRQPEEMLYFRSLLQKEMEQEAFLQYCFSAQWQSLREAAEEKGIRIIGDLPIFVSFDSADVWAHPELFDLDSTGYPRTVAGVPPDYFSVTGQLWGNPLYLWKAHKKEDYTWWKRRIRRLLSMVDYIRMDHFRGFARFWEIPASAKTAVEGKWVDGPGQEFFISLGEDLGDLPLIAEDLGIITEEVYELKEALDLPGMYVLQFAFGENANNSYLPHMQKYNGVVYTGTHDNNTSIGWYHAASETEKDHFRRYLNSDGSSPSWDMIRLAMSCPAKWAIFPLQDVLSLDEGARMNVPGTPEENWRFRFTFEQWKDSDTKGLAYLSKLFGRNL